jgi:hypothetical protein
MVGWESKNAEMRLALCQVILFPAELDCVPCCIVDERLKKPARKWCLQNGVPVVEFAKQWLFIVGRSIGRECVDEQLLKTSTNFKQKHIPFS